MSSNADLGSSVDKIMRSLDRASTEAQNNWRDKKFGEFKTKHLDNIGAGLETLQETLVKLEEIIQSSKKSFPLE